MPLILPGNVGSATAATGFNVANSCRFNPADSAYMHKTPDAGNRRTFTFSCWVKRSLISSAQTLFWAGSSNDDYFAMRFEANNKFSLFEAVSGATNWGINTNRVFKDISAWYHVVVAVDTTQGTAANRTKIYFNGIQETNLNTGDGYPAENRDTIFNTAVPHQIGHDYVGQYFGGYIAEACFLEGSQNAPTDFGEFDDSGIWKPINVSGLTFGTNGFYLDFEASGNLGNDANGGTDLTESGLAAIDQSTDTCTNNFATMNPLDNFYAGSTFSEGNLNLVMADAPTTWNTSTIGVSSGKWYFEVKELAEGASGSSQVGVADRPTVSASEELGGLATTFAYTSNGRFRTDNGQTAADKATWGVNDVIGIALDMDASPATVTFTKNGSAAGSTQNLTATGTGFYFLAIGAWVDGSVTFSANFGSPAYSESGGNSDGSGYGNFKTAPPSGHFALNTKNLAEYG